MRLHPSLSGELNAVLAPATAATTAAQAGAKQTGGASFAALHTAALAGAAPGTDVSTPSTPTTPTSATDTAAVKLRKGERMEAVDGHRYASITAGQRRGMFVNTSGNARQGEAFVRVVKRGIEYHIYGTGKDRLVVALKPKADAAPAAAPATGDTTTGATAAPSTTAPARS
jgi:hypothetical protein